MSIPRPEYPRPQFERMDWINLNGEWTLTDYTPGSFAAEGKGFRKNIIKSFTCSQALLSALLREMQEPEWLLPTLLNRAQVTFPQVLPRSQ